MHHLVGATLMILGLAGAVVVFFCNSQTPVQLGPVPFFGACAVAFVGLLVWSF